MWNPPARDGAPSGVCLTGPELALHLGAALIRRSIFESVDAFDETVSHAEDWDWFMRVRERGLYGGGAPRGDAPLPSARRQHEQR